MPNDIPSIDYRITGHPEFKYALRQPYFHRLLTELPYPYIRHEDRMDGSPQPLSPTQIRVASKRNPFSPTERWEHPRRVMLVTWDAFALHIGAGYAWDGATGPAVDTVTILRASLVHDALYQCVATLPDGCRDVWKDYADRELIAIARQDGMTWTRRLRVWLGVRFGGKARTPYEAPPDV